jgi:hypothetical protein
MVSWVPNKEIPNKETRNSGKIINSFFELFPAPAAGWLPNS